ncbi:uncharacterized protein VDAG_06230 [Verticillium dahliae VdLs.17]|uniref:Transmembrane protein n=1 Tax=Verticillium dahliae (strain VdLs.17 / ATCC MYA-4575 / FGSC 10137) TaxID=498257 RepID=G2X8T9_VERDV|nr:uncharacterized protein VDAG_06230 [Verticillium dahliae VdLs.17]EGY15376.1 hypothetical protein VDAG_06230 [Verticillium dahliae VdLs.17]
MPRHLVGAVVCQAFSVLSGTAQTRSTRLLVVTVFIVIVFLFLGNSQLAAGPYLGSTTDTELSPEHFANQHKQAASNKPPPPAGGAAGQTPPHQDSNEVKHQPPAETVDDNHDHDHDPKADTAIDELNESIPDPGKVPDPDVWHDDKEDERLAVPAGLSPEADAVSTPAVPVATSHDVAAQSPAAPTSAIVLATTGSVVVAAASPTPPLRPASEIDN